MKKLIGIICLLCYLASSIGLSVAISYCDEKVTGISLYQPNDVQCCCSDEIENECCDDDIIKVDKTDDHYSFAPQFNFDLSSPLVTFFFPQSIWDHLGQATSHSRVAIIPPPPILTRELQLHLLLAVVRI